MFTGSSPAGAACVGFLTRAALTLGSMMSRMVRILLAAMVAVALSGVAVNVRATAEGPELADRGQLAVERHEVAPEGARPGGGADPLETGVVVVLNTLLLGGLVGGLLWARRRLGCADSIPRQMTV